MLDATMPKPTIANKAVTDVQQEAYDAVLKHGTIRAAARALGKNYTSVYEAYNKAKAKLELDPGVADALDEVGIQDPTRVRGGWLKTKHASVQFTMPRAEAIGVEDSAERIRMALADIPPPEPIEAPTGAVEGLLTLYPMPDIHAGLRTDAQTLEGTVERLVGGMRDCVSRSPKSATGVVLVLGDMLHHNDNENATPASKHALDVLATIEETAQAMIAGLARCIEIALLHHPRVIVSVLRGNHDRDAYLIVLYSLAERYRNHQRIDVQRDEGEFFVIQHGKCLLAAHHGDKAKPERLVMALADEFPQLWGETRHRFYYTGHLHHHKSADIGGVQWEQLRAVTKRDRYAKDNAYTARSQMQAITFDEEVGEVSRVKVGL